MNTETGLILKDLKESKKNNELKVRNACIYAAKNNLPLKSVGIYEFDNGHCIQDRFPAKEAKNLFDTINKND